MQQALKSLLFGAVDYAGLFPPAQLEMSDALGEYRRHWANPQESWILDKFVCPADRLEELATLLEQAPPDLEFDLSVIASQGTSFHESVHSDLGKIRSFESTFGGRFCVEAYEARTTGNIKSDCSELHALGNIELFLEIPPDGAVREHIHSIAQDSVVGAKLRTGGLTPQAFPSTKVVSEFIHEAYALEIEFKLTAGLHHPIRRDDPEIGASMHGFLNVFVGAALTFHHDLSPKELQRVLDERDPGAFGFTEHVVRWRELEADLDTIEEMRGAFGAFGSCSVREPLNDLKALGLLEGVAL